MGRASGGGGYGFEDSNMGEEDGKWGSPSAEVELREEYRFKNGAVYKG
jgi:hypothetical protein